MYPKSRAFNLFTSELVLGVLWGICFARGFNFYTDTRSEFLLYQSGNAAADFRFSQLILVCYSVSFFIGLALVWLAYRHRRPLFTVLGLSSFLTVASVILARPESVVVLIPDLTPFIALLGSVMLAVTAGIGLTIAYFRKRADSM